MLQAYLKRAAVANFYTKCRKQHTEIVRQRIATNKNRPVIKETILYFVQTGMIGRFQKVYFSENTDCIKAS